MVRPRVVETEQGIQGGATVEMYDQIQWKFRDCGWIETGALIKRGITGERALEMGPGPDYLGLEWLRRTRESRLTGLNISWDMVAFAEKNAREYGLAHRAEYVGGDVAAMPFPEHTFNAVFTNGSLHEWAEPRGMFDEIGRVVKLGGRVCISDPRWDTSTPIRPFLWLATTPRAIRPGLTSWPRAARIPEEAQGLIRGTRLAFCTVTGNFLGLTVFGLKPS